MSSDDSVKTEPGHSHDRSALVDLAWDTLEALVNNQHLPGLRGLPSFLPKKAGCFVSIHLEFDHELRGCIGTIEPACSTLCEEVIQNTISAASRDPRFPPIQKDELPDLVINVDVLHEPEPATMYDLDPQRYGVIVEQGYRRGLLLPDLEGVDTVEQQVTIACQKAGIDPSSDFEIERFEVERYE